MSEEQNTPTPEGTPSPTPEQPKQPEAKPGPQKSEKSVVRYLTVLFAAAFVLLLITFVMENRQHQLELSESQEQIETLDQKSKSAVQSLQNVIDENKELKAEKDQWELRREELEAQVGQQDKSLEAMDWLWQISEAYGKRRYTYARELIAAMEEKQLVDCLPKESTTGNDSMSPYDRYMDIRDRLL